MLSERPASLLGLPRQYVQAARYSTELRGSGSHLHLPRALVAIKVILCLMEGVVIVVVVVIVEIEVVVVVVVAAVVVSVVVVVVIVTLLAVVVVVAD